MRRFQLGSAVQRNAQRSSIFDLAAWASAITGFIFWFNAYWMFLQPGGDIIVIIFTVSIALSQALIAPLLLSMLIPSTPAGMLLQQSNARTWGHVFIIGITGFLLYHNYNVVSAFWASRPTVVASGMVQELTISSLVIFVGFLALAYAQAISPDWVEQVRQAHAVERVRKAMKFDLAAHQAYYARALILMRQGLANLLPLERQEVAAVMQRLDLDVGRSLDKLQSLVGDAIGVQGLPPLLNEAATRDKYAELYDYLEESAAHRKQLADDAPVMSRSGAQGRAKPAPNTYTEPHLTPPYDAAALNDIADNVRDSPSERAKPVHEAYTEPHENDCPGQSPTAPHGANYAVARRELRGAWRVTDLARVLGVEKETAYKVCAAWRDAHLVSGEGLSNGRYSFTDQGGN